MDALAGSSLTAASRTFLLMLSLRSEPRRAAILHSWVCLSLQDCRTFTLIVFEAMLRCRCEVASE